MNKNLLLLFNLLFSALLFSQDGSLNISFVPATNNYTGIQCIAVQPDNKVLVGSDAYLGQAIPIQAIARLNANGSIDNSFIAPAGYSNFHVFSIVVQPDGKIIVGGSDNGSGVKNYITRLNLDGSIDQTFNVGVGANDMVRSITLQPDGKIILAGNFTLFNGQPSTYLVRLNSNGSIDNSFNPPWNPNSFITSCTLLQNGKIIIKGVFTELNGITNNYIARLNADGTLDTSFDSANTINDFVHSNVVEDSNGKILFGASFSINGIAKHRVIRLNIDGTLDTTFNLSNETNSPVYSIAIQSNQKILIGGDFNYYNGISIKSFARLNNDGSLDSSFNVGTGANGTVSSIVPTNNNSVFISGGFSQYNGTNIIAIAKIAANNNLGTIEIAKSTFNIYPNPVIDRLFIDHKDILNYEILNMNGQKISSGKQEKSFIDVSKLLRGSYLLKFTLKNQETITKKFIKQ